MKGLQRDILKNILVGVMMSIMAMLIVNQVLYVHTHILPDGEVITHSHPFSRSGGNGSNPGHHHCNCEYHILANVYLLYFALLTGLIKFFTSIGIVLFSDHIFSLRNILCSHVKGRAPPDSFFH